MKKTAFIIIYITFTFCHAKAQIVYPNWAWGNLFNGKVAAIEYHGDFIYTAATFSDSSFIYGNANITNHGNQDVVIMKWDTLGNMLWATSIWGTNNDTVVNLKVNANNELVVVGSSNSSSLNAGGNLLTSNGGFDIFTAKYDLNGNAINAYIHGTANDEYAIDMCTDNQSNIYIARDGNLTKFDNTGLFAWQKIITATEGNTIRKLSYSVVDATIVLCGSFAGTFTLNNLTITSYLNANNNWQSHIYLAKLGTDGSSVWLNNYSMGSQSSYNPNMFVHSNGKIYITCTYFGLSAHYYFFEVLTNGSLFTQTWAGIPMPQPYDQFSETEVSSISGYGNYVSVNYHAPMGTPAPVGFAIYNINTHSLEKIYHASLGVHVFRSLFAMYTSGFFYTNKCLAKIGDGSLIGLPSNQALEVCSGNLTTLTGNITGGIGPLTYSWLPVTGLNNTNTNTVTFTAINNITYTLTVTDTAGQNARDTFNIMVQNPVPPANITSQFPSFCDIMQLYSNNGIEGDWYEFLPGNLPNNQWQLIATDTVVTINAAGMYRYAKTNACNSVADTIVVPGTVTVNANASSDSICAGQSVTLSGNGALSYTWTGGVINNVPFNPSATQTYIVTGTDGNGCSNTSFIQITILSSNNTSITSICENQIPYNWNGMNLDSSGTYTITYTNIYGCDSTEILHLTVSPCIVCVPNFTINYSPFYNSLTESQSWIITSGTVLIEAGTQVKLDAHQTSYVIMNPGFKVDSGAVFVAQAYNGCTAGAPQLPQERMIANADLMTNNEIVLYPNPTSGMIHIQHDEKLINIQIFDMVGKLIINQKCNGETETNIDLSHLPNGVYHVKAAGYQSVKVVKND